MASVFISSTGMDLAEYRAGAIEVCNRLGLIPVAMEFFEAMGAGATQGSVTKLEVADVYVGIFAHRYGFIEPGRAASVTELEFDHAGARRLERLCFMLKEGYPWPPSAVDHEHIDELNRFKAKVNRQLIRQEFTSVDDFKAKLMQSLIEWQKHRAEPSVLESMLDLFATRRAFFKGDEQALDHVLKMLDYSDAGRALVVARSLAESAAEIEGSLRQLRSSTHSSLKDAVGRLIVACKDYAERYGARPEEESMLGLPHIGWGQRLANFAVSDSRFGFTSSGSIETFKEFIEYLAQSFRDLVTVRDLAKEVVSRIATAEPTLAERCGVVGSQISCGGSDLRHAVAELELGAQRVGEIVSSTSDFQARRMAAADMAKGEASPTVARLLIAVSKIRGPVAWLR